MDVVCSNSSAYQPSALVSSFHSIPHVDIDLNPSPDNFEISLGYFEAIIIWACVPILCVVCLFILMAVYFICVCCCCCFQQHDKRSKASKGVCGSFVILLVLLCLAMVGVALWAEYDLDQNIIQSVNAARGATGILNQLGNVSTSYTYNQSGTELNLISLDSGIMTEGGIGSGMAQQSTTVLRGLNQGLGVVFPQVQQQIAPLAAVGNFDSVFSAVDYFELARHWAVIAYLIVIAILLILVAMSVCCSACCASPVCMVVMLVVFFFITFVMWVAVGGNLALLVASGDICFDPDTLIRNYTTLLPNSTVTTELLDYYLICQETCYPSPLQPFFDNASAVFVDVSQNEIVIQTYLDNITNSFLQNLQNLVVSTFDEAEGVVNTTEMLANCTGLNGEYLNALNNLCAEGYMSTVILFAMACGIAVGMMVIMVCGSFYAGLLSEGRVYDDETVVYDFPNSGNSPWDSYGTQQHYTPYTESFNMRASPPPNGSESQPPKYTDLTLTHGFNGDGTEDVNVRHSNGYGNDGTVGVAVRHSNVDIDLGEPLEP